MKTRSEVEELKRQWESDPCWDLGDTEEFEEYEAELIAHQSLKQTEWKTAYQEKIDKKAEQLKISPELAEYILSLETKLQELGRRIDRLSDIPF